jgi:hypothetical protein
MNNLIELYANEYSGINDNGIKNVNLIKLNANNNSNITNVNHMNKLKELFAHGRSGISDEGINKLNLSTLHAYNNLKITKESNDIELNDDRLKHFFNIITLFSGIKNLNLKKLNS